MVSCRTALVLAAGLAVGACSSGPATPSPGMAEQPMIRLSCGDSVTATGEDRFATPTIEGSGPVESVPTLGSVGLLLAGRTEWLFRKAPLSRTGGRTEATTATRIDGSPC